MGLRKKSAHDRTSGKILPDKLLELVEEFGAELFLETVTIEPEEALQAVATQKQQEEEE